MTKALSIVVNENDEVIGYKHRTEIAKDEIYRVSALWVTNSKGDVLLAQRKFTKLHNPGQWSAAVAGTVDQDETYDSNIVKEAEEELGIVDVKFKKGPKVRISNEFNFFCHWYTAVIDKPAEDFRFQEDAIEQVAWFSRSFLEKDQKAHPGKYLDTLPWALKEFA